MKLLTYTPRAERTKAPAGDELDHNTDWRKPFVYWCQYFTGSIVIPSVPCVHVETVPTIEDWRDGTCEDYTSHLFFSNRKGFKNAWRLARIIRRGNGHPILKPEEIQVCQQVDINLGFRHSLREYVYRFDLKKEVA